MIADLHCHFPMQLVHDELDQSRFEQVVFDLATHIFDHPWSKDWRVNVDKLNEGGVGIVCSVLYWPPSEFLRGWHRRPRRRSFSTLKRQLKFVEDRIKGAHVIVRHASDLDKKPIRFVHCVEGGFHLGPDEGAMRENIGWLSKRGVYYITLAHLFFRGVATNAPAFPILSDKAYDRIFCQPKKTGLTPLGKKAVRAMVEHKVVVDVSHMRQKALDDTFALLDELDDKRKLPVIASHVGVRSEGPDGQHYNLTPETMQKIKERKGVIGLILSQHQMGKTADPEASRAVLYRHITAIDRELGSHEYTAFGSDMDGFVNPMLAGFDSASEMNQLEDWIHEDFGKDAEAILHGNAERVLKRTYELRDTAGRS